MGPCASRSNSRYRAIPSDMPTLVICWAQAIFFDMPLWYYAGYRPSPPICHYGTILGTGHLLLLRYAYYGTMLGTAQAKLGPTQLIS